MTRAAVALSLALAAALAHAQNWPAKPVRFVVPFPPGGATDVAARTVSDRLSRALGQQFVVENRPGAGSSLGPAAVARARPDGYLLTQLPTSAIRLSFIQRMSYDPLRDFAAVAHLSNFQLGFGVGIMPATCDPLLERLGRVGFERYAAASQTFLDGPFAEDAIRELAALLKQRCGTGGTVKNGRIEIQGG